LFDAHDRQDRAEAWNVQVTDKVVTPQTGVASASAMPCEYLRQNISHDTELAILVRVGGSE
jgi:hypothetical protein